MDTDILVAISRDLSVLLMNNQWLMSTVSHEILVLFELQFMNILTTISQLYGSC